MIAEASECAADQKRFWAFHDAVFTLLTRRAMNGPADIDVAARDARLDLGPFETCRESGRTRGTIESELKEGESRGVDGTPTIFVNGRMIVGNQPVEIFRSEINAARNR
jgi:protein-disulfide isomerase